MLKLLSTEWLWWVIGGGFFLAGMLATKYYRDKGRNPFPTKKVLEQNKEKIHKFSDGFTLLALLGLLILSTWEMKPWDFNKEFFFWPAVSFSILAAYLISHLSYFENSITVKKRLILFAISLLPTLFGVLNFYLTDFRDVAWMTIKYVIGSQFFVLLVNGPAIFTGKSLYCYLDHVIAQFKAFWSKRDNTHQS
jgi:hypothetical protein